MQGCVDNSVSDPFYFDTDPDPRICFWWLQIRIRGNFNFVNLVFLILGYKLYLLYNPKFNEK